MRLEYKAREIVFGRHTKADVFSGDQGDATCKWSSEGTWIMGETGAARGNPPDEGIVRHVPHTQISVCELLSTAIPHHSGHANCQCHTSDEPAPQPAPPTPVSHNTAVCNIYSISCISIDTLSPLEMTFPPTRHRSCQRQAESRGCGGGTFLRRGGSDCSIGPLKGTGNGVACCAGVNLIFKFLGRFMRDTSAVRCTSFFVYIPVFRVLYHYQFLVRPVPRFPSCHLTSLCERGSILIATVQAWKAKPTGEKKKRRVFVCVRTGRKGKLLPLKYTETEGRHWFPDNLLPLLNYILEHILDALPPTTMYSYGRDDLLKYVYRALSTLMRSGIFAENKEPCRCSSPCEAEVHTHKISNYEAEDLSEKASKNEKDHANKALNSETEARADKLSSNEKYKYLPARHRKAALDSMRNAAKEEAELGVRKGDIDENDIHLLTNEEFSLRVHTDSAQRHEVCRAEPGGYTGCSPPPDLAADSSPPHPCHVFHHRPLASPYGLLKHVATRAHHRQTLTALDS
ncbi:hypothetical protein PR048_023456 [Dryococelus australis]|uniref:Uncharacterized protein n=1 Tax=Dryococelus australis TaxID=614101 RepID=A0ABQ9GU38_9NEOP|nr:hypothetical protein PR048_023456 [Dryococelus australis]